MTNDSEINCKWWNLRQEKVRYFKCLKTFYVVQVCKFWQCEYPRRAALRARACRGLVLLSLFMSTGRKFVCFCSSCVCSFASLLQKSWHWYTSVLLSWLHARSCCGSCFGGFSQLWTFGLNHFQWSAIAKIRSDYSVLLLVWEQLSFNRIECQKTQELSCYDRIYVRFQDGHNSIWSYFEATLLVITYKKSSTSMQWSIAFLK